MQINYKSDFKIHLPLTDVAGGSIPFPDYDFRIELTTTKRDRVFTASSVDGELTNCTDDNGRILVVADSHGLPPGRLHCRFTAYIPDPAFPDGINEQIQETDLDIWLVPGIADIPAQISAEMQLPVAGNAANAYQHPTFLTPGVLRYGATYPAIYTNFGFIRMRVDDNHPNDMVCIDDSDDSWQNRVYRLNIPKIPGHMIDDAALAAVDITHDHETKSLVGTGRAFNEGIQSWPQACNGLDITFYDIPICTMENGPLSYIEVLTGGVLRYIRNAVFQLPQLTAPPVFYSGNNGYGGANGILDEGVEMPILTYMALVSPLRKVQVQFYKNKPSKRDSRGKGRWRNVWKGSEMLLKDRRIWRYRYNNGRHKSSWRYITVAPRGSGSDMKIRIINR